LSIKTVYLQASGGKPHPDSLKMLKRRKKHGKQKRK